MKAGSIEWGLRSKKHPTPQPIAWDAQIYSEKAQRPEERVLRV